MILGDAVGFALASLVVSAVACCAVVKIAGRTGARRPWAVGVLCALVVMEVSATLLLPGSAGVTDGVCYVNCSPANVLMTTQGILNIGMFVPIGASAVMATRSPLLSLAGAASLSVATEFAQATVFGRNCDSNDFLANFVGAAVGVLAVHMASVLSGRPQFDWKRGVKHSGGVLLALLFAVGVSVNTVIIPVALDDSSIRLSSTSQEDAARAAMRRAFGDHVNITKTTLRPGTEGAEDHIVIAFANGIAQLAWPSRSEFSVLLEPESTPGKHSFPLDPPAPSPAGTSDAQKIAHTYAASRYPAQMAGASVKTLPVGDDAEFGWITSWRTSEDGVLLPNRLDVQVNRAGRISQLVVREFSASYDIPRDRIRKDAALRVVQNETGIDPDHASEHLIKRDGTYKVTWVVDVSHSADDVESFFVDSLSGEMIDHVPGVSVDPDSRGAL
ncbi:VanZ family protein [Streptomyces sp. bgisy022]|uniref:VanZ family protein n=1 Tax=Streptomyces sp. bgisy022 TaxID=3413769 RepID=UPI003D751B3A